MYGCEPFVNNMVDGGPTRSAQQIGAASPELGGRVYWVAQRDPKPVNTIRIVRTRMTMSSQGEKFLM